MTACFSESNNVIVSVWVLPEADAETKLSVQYLIGRSSQKAVLAKWAVRQERRKPVKDGLWNRLPLMASGVQSQRGTVADRVSMLRYSLRQEEARVFTLQIQATSTTLGMSSSWRKDQEEGLRWKVRVLVGNFRMGSGILSV